MQFSVSVEGWFGLGWPEWKRLVQAIPQLGFQRLFLSDHLQLSTLGATPCDSLELIVALTYLAMETEQIHFGAMVSPLSIREPVQLARQSIALDLLSNGRMIVGVGAGWNEAEHDMFGYKLGDVPTRMQRFAEGLEVLTLLLRQPGPVSFTGQHFCLREASILPRPTRPNGPPIMIGGSGPRRTLPLIAQYADRWDAGFLSLADFQARSAQLNQLLHTYQRPTHALLRCATIPIICGETPAELEQRVRGIRRMGGFGDLPLDQLLSTIKRDLNAVVGTPAEVIGELQAYLDAGVDEIVVQWSSLDDIDGLAQIAQHVLPYLKQRVAP